MPLKVAIIDDDVVITDILKKLISLYPTLELAGCCSNVTEAKTFFETHIVDIVLLDVELSDGMGFEIIPFISGEPFLIIITSNEHYAFTAFEVGAVDFIKKPILPARFKKSIDKIMEQAALKQKQTLDKDENSNKNKPFLFVKTGAKIVKIDIETLTYAEALRDYIKLVLNTKENHLINLSLTELAKRLQPYGFMQVHRSYLVNTRHIKQVQDDMVFLPGIEIPIGKTYKSIINELLK
ncbi:MAG: LytR/AlgR family response regulator transcription factor [Chitinophagaceae bacterium]